MNKFTALNKFIIVLAACAMTAACNNEPKSTETIKNETNLTQKVDTVYVENPQTGEMKMRLDTSYVENTK